jgi:hypothetical protein
MKLEKNILAIMIPCLDPWHYFEQDSADEGELRMLPSSYDATVLESKATDNMAGAN